MKRTSVVLLVLALATAACSKSTSQPQPEPPIASYEPAPDSPVSTIVPPPGNNPFSPLAPKASPVVPQPGQEDVHPIAWDKADVSKNGDTVTLSYWSGIEPCSVLDHVDVAYTTKTVTITLFEGHAPTGGTPVACAEIAMLKSVSVTLDQPLAGRTIVDGAKPTTG